MPTRRSDLALVVLFLAIISLPLASTIAGRDGGDSEAENRELAHFPHFELSRHGLAGYAPAFIDWFDDHFGLRASFVRWYGISRFFWLGVSPSAAVVKGRDGWLFYGDDGALDDATSEVLFTPDQVDGWRRTLVAAHDWLRARDIGYLFVMAPDKHVIYPEALPPTMIRAHAASRMDQLDAMLRSATHVPTIDVRGALAAAKPHERLYGYTDTHWNDWGAFVAYQQIIGAIRHQLPTVPPAWTRADFEAEERPVPGQDLARMMGLMRVLREDDLILRPKRPRQARVVEPPGGIASNDLGWLVTEIPGATLPRALVFRDSFTSRLAPFLSEHFSRAAYMWENDFDANLVEKEHPDIVIQELVGRHLYVFTPSPGLVPSRKEVSAKASGKR